MITIKQYTSGGVRFSQIERNFSQVGSSKKNSHFGWYWRGNGRPPIIILFSCGRVSLNADLWWIMMKTAQMKMTMMLQMLEKWQWRLMTKRLQFISPNLKLSLLSCYWVIAQGKVNKPWVWVGCTCGSAYVEKGAEVMISDGTDQVHHHQRWRWWHGWSRGSRLERWWSSSLLPGFGTKLSFASHSCQELEQNYHLHSPWIRDEATSALPQRMKPLKPNRVHHSR